jgi:hypothetical protein
MSRDNFSKPVVTALRMRAGFICSNPVCRANTVAAAEPDDDSVVCLGKAAHIAAAAAGGPRFDAQMLPSERASISNAIYLCAACADLIDKNGGADYSSELLQEWKGQHETWVRSNLNKRSQGIGGEGGSGIIVGNRGTIIGGKGGDARVSGFGGNGGSALSFHPALHQSRVHRQDRKRRCGRPQQRNARSDAALPFRREARLDTRTALRPQ